MNAPPPTDTPPGLSPSGGRPLAVVDVDGVVADVRHRLHHLESRPKNWDAFFAAAEQDPLLAEGAALAQELSRTHDLRWLSGRPGKLRQATERWLDRHGLPRAEMLLRRRGDFRPAAVVKVEILHRLSVDRTVGVLVDDDPRVCAAAEEAGFPVFRATWMESAPLLQQAQESEGRT